MRLADIAPRLALARDAYEAEQARLRAARRRRENDAFRLRRLVAHRELQLARAQASGNGSYIDLRQRKLDQARRLLERTEQAA